MDKHYNNIKELFINNEINRKVKNYSINRNDLMTYYNVGKEIIEAQGGESRAKYGDNLIKEYSRKLIIDLKKNYSTTTLKRMRQFYLIIQKGAQFAHLSWSHYQVLLPMKDINKINYYINISIGQNIGRDELRERVKNSEYERLDNETKNKLIENKDTNVSDFIKNPIVIKNSLGHENINEKELKRLIIENMDNFLKELGLGFTYVGNEYKIKVDSTYNYIDILLYNYIYKCFTVVELKLVPLKAEHVGQITKYLNYIDKNIKRADDNNTIGIILSERNNKIVLEYCSDSRIFFKEFVLV